MAKFLEYIGNRKEGTLLVKKASVKSQYRKVKYNKDQIWKLEKDLPENIGYFIYEQCPTLFKIRIEKDDPKELFEDMIQKAVDIQKEHGFNPIDILKKYFNIPKNTNRGRPKSK